MRWFDIFTTSFTAAGPVTKEGPGQGLGQGRVGRTQTRSSSRSSNRLRGPGLGHSWTEHAADSGIGTDRETRTRQAVKWKLPPPSLE